MFLNSAKMIMLARSFFVVAILLMGTNEAFVNPPLTVDGLSSYDETTVEKFLENSKMMHKESDDDDLRTDPKSNEPKTIYVYQFDYESNEKDDETRSKGKNPGNGSGETQSPLDPWSIVWYIGSFGGLVAFFLIVSCSEWCCRRNGRQLGVPYGNQRAEVVSAGNGATETPPPPYHLFAPPSYDSVNYGDIIDKTSGEKLEIYVISVPIHHQVVLPPA
ncbi:uncharacterized protein [Prorops nasuta]|uniref:uncharacterized protein n=1 Tax=Prorops nasuta TaxID=863751 RepID=UPI0034CF2CF6